MRARRYRQHGAAAVEFALALLVLLPLLGGLVGLGGVFYDELALIDALRAGAQYALVQQQQATVGDVQAAAQRSGAVDLPGIQVATPSFVQLCADGSAPQNGSCASGDPTPWNLLSISASYVYTVGLAGLVPGLPSTLTLRQTALFRIS